MLNPKFYQELRRISKIRENLTNMEDFIIAVNARYNGFEYISDETLGKGEDYWQTPEEFLTVNGGDCEDFALIKYSVLSAYIPEKQLTLVYCRILATGASHMVLEVKWKDKIYILDNFVSELMELKDREDLLFVYSFNQHGMWVDNKPAVHLKNSKFFEWLRRANV